MSTSSAGFSTPSSSSAPLVLSKSTFDRQIKEKNAWEQAKGLLRSDRQRPRGPTLDATREAIQPMKKNSKQNLARNEDINERKSQLQHILGAAYLPEDPARAQE